MPVCESSYEKTSAFWLQQQQCYADSNRENKSPNNEPILVTSAATSPRGLTAAAAVASADAVVDDLVSTLKSKLQLKSPSYASLFKQRRAATGGPYSLDARNKTTRAHHRSLLGLADTSGDENQLQDDVTQSWTRMGQKVPCTLMRELLNEGSLIKEAVKRLQMKTRRHSCDFEGQSTSSATDNTNCDISDTSDKKFAMLV